MSKTQKAAAAPREQEWLNGAERARLQILEARIATALDNQVTAGRDLAEIRDGRLHRESGATFEDYCRAKFGLSRPRLYQLMSLVEVRAIVSTTVDTPSPETERVARELAPLRSDPAAMNEVWADAVDEADGGQPTAAGVRTARIVRDLPVPVDPGQDLRYAHVEDADSILAAIAPRRTLWPTSEGEIEAIGACLKRIAAWSREMDGVWREHNAALKAQKRKLRAVA